jgi:hypothetical protein
LLKGTVWKTIDRVEFNSLPLKVFERGFVKVINASKLTKERGKCPVQNRSTASA